MSPSDLSKQRASEQRASEMHIVDDTLPARGAIIIIIIIIFPKFQSFVFWMKNQFYSFYYYYYYYYRNCPSGGQSVIYDVHFTSALFTSALFTKIRGRHKIRKNSLARCLLISQGDIKSKKMTNQHFRAKSRKGVKMAKTSLKSVFWPPKSGFRVI